MKHFFALYIILTLLVFSDIPLQAARGGDEFAAIAFHDVVDFKGDLDDDAVTTDNLIVFLEWLKGNQWTAISLDDIENARRGIKPLPERAILITFDDGYVSLYQRVYPLLLAYRIPIVVSLVGSWMDTPAGEQVSYGDMKVPRAKFLSWDQAREMQRSGLVEFASHGYDMHRGILANPQGNEIGAAYTRAYVKGQGYEDRASFRKRLAADLNRSRELMHRELGKTPRTITWPYGRYTGDGIEVAKECGFSMALTVNHEPPNVNQPFLIGRYLPSHNPKLPSIVDSIKQINPFPAGLRMVAVDPGQLWADGADGMDDRLGRAIERLRVLGVTTVVIDAGSFDANGKLTAVWFPNSKLPVRADILSRIAWQMHNRGGVDVVVRLPIDATHDALKNTSYVTKLFHELGSHVSLNGLFVERSPGLLSWKNSNVTKPATPWEIRQNRREINSSNLSAQDRMALEAFRALEYQRPGLKLFLLAEELKGGLPSSLADVTLIKVDPGNIEKSKIINHLSDHGWMSPVFSHHCGLWFQGPQISSARDIIDATRLFQRNGGTVVGWAVDDMLGDRPNSKELAKSVSASTFPINF